MATTTMTVSMMSLVFALGLLVVPVQQVGAAECGVDPDQPHCSIYAAGCTKATCWPDKPFKEQCKVHDPDMDITYEGQAYCKPCQDKPDIWCDEKRPAGLSCGEAGKTDPVSLCREKLHQAYIEYQYPKKEGKYANFDEACGAMAEVMKCYEDLKSCSIGAAWGCSMGTGGPSGIVLTKDWAQCPGMENLRCEVAMQCAGGKDRAWGKTVKVPDYCDPVTLKALSAEEAAAKKEARLAAEAKEKDMVKAKSSLIVCKKKMVEWGMNLAEKGCISGNWDFDQEKVCAANWECDAREKCTTTSDSDCATALAPAYGQKIGPWSRPGMCKVGADSKMVCGAYTYKDETTWFCSAEEDVSEAQHDPAGESSETDPGAKAFGALKKCTSPNICDSEASCQELTINFAIEEVELKELKNAQKSRIQNFVKTEFAKAAGVDKNDVTVKLHEGSIIVEVTIKTANAEASKAAVTGDAGAEVAKKAVAAASNNFPCGKDCKTAAPSEGAIAPKTTKKAETAAKDDDKGKAAGGDGKKVAAEAGGDEKEEEKEKDTAKEDSGSDTDGSVPTASPLGACGLLTLLFLAAVQA